MMKGAVLTENGFELINMKVPNIKKDEVLVRTAACGICSGDVFLYKNRATMAAKNRFLGHEASGVIVAAGDQVENFTPGESVTALASPAYAQYFVARPADLVNLPDAVQPEYALGEAVACCVHAAGRFGIQPGDKVAVVGCGFMGLLCLQLALYQGAGFVCAIDPLLERRVMSQRLGAHMTMDPLTTSSSRILESQGEFDVVIEATGVQSAVNLCTDLVREHGRLILVGYHQSNNGLRTINMQKWNYKAIDVINGHVRRQAEKALAMKKGMDLLAEGRLATKPMVTLFDFADIETTFQRLAASEAKLFKAVLCF